MADRHVIVVDVETSGRDPERHAVVEVAWQNLRTGENDVFIPRHTPSEVLAAAEIEALRVNRYLDRLTDVELQDHTGEDAATLANQLHGHTLAGANPRFDWEFLRRMFAAFDTDEFDVFVPEPHYRLLDLSAYAAGVLGLPINELPGLSDVCGLLGIERAGKHTAADDVRDTAACFRVLAEKAGER